MKTPEKIPGVNYDGLTWDQRDGWVAVPSGPKKVGGRWEEHVRSGDVRSGAQLTVTRRGVEVFAWYDSFVGNAETIVLTWDELDAMRERVEQGRKVPRTR